MAQIIVRNLDSELKNKLKMQAQLKGRSMEEEARRILAKSLDNSNAKTGDVIHSYFSEVGFDDDLQLMDRSQEIRNIEFD